MLADKWPRNLLLVKVSPILHSLPERPERFWPGQHLNRAARPFLLSQDQRVDRAAQAVASFIAMRLDCTDCIG